MRPDKEADSDLAEVLAGFTTLIMNERVRAYNEGFDDGRSFKLQARPADGGEWIDIFPAQLQWMAKEGNDVRAISIAQQFQHKGE